MNNEKQYKIKKEIFSYIKTLSVGVIVALFFMNFIIANAKVPSGSMENTIQIGDRLMAFRLSYFISDPMRGDIVIFENPDYEIEKENKLLIKRIVGLPGETLNIKNGKVYINDIKTPLQEDYLKEPFYGDFGPYVIPSDCYFMMGDNRNGSKDARVWTNKYVHQSKIIGKAIFKYFPGVKVY